MGAHLLKIFKYFHILTNLSRSRHGYCKTESNYDEIDWDFESRKPLNDGNCSAMTAGVTNTEKAMRLDAQFALNAFSRAGVEPKTIRLNIGDYHASRNPVTIYTLLGSCVAVCLSDMEKGVGGMNHILMPGQADWQQFNGRTRYAVNAMELLINRIMNLGGRRHKLTAKVFGGAHVIGAIDEKNGVGRRNAEFVFDFLENEGIPVGAYEVGGIQARKVYFYPQTGRVLLRYVQAANFSRMAMDEKQSMQRVAREMEKEGNITLF
jgi:chemotaxis protein CheD